MARLKDSIPDRPANCDIRQLARIVPFKLAAPRSKLKDLPGVQWNGGKPAGLPKGEAMREGVSLSAWINEDRR